MNLEKVIGLSPNSGNYQIKMDKRDFSEFRTSLAKIPAPLDELLQRAFLQRPDLVRAQKEIDYSQSSLNSVRGSYWPELNLKGSYSAYDTDLSTFQDQWQVGIGLNWNFFSGFRTNGEIAEAKANLRGSKARLRNIELTAVQEVSNSFYLAQEKRESVFLADKILTLAGENLSLADGRYKTGLGDMIEYNDAQLRFTKAKANLVTTFFTYNIALAQLENTIGQFPDMVPATEQQPEVKQQQ